MSKLAALAAKRRQKENVRPLRAEQSGALATDDYASSLKALRISSPAPLKSKTNVHDGDQVGAAANVTSADNNLNINQEKQSKADTTDPHELEVGFEPKSLTAQPSPFANIILGARHQAQPLSIASAIDHPLLGGHAQAFDFTAPSPDDVVTRAQTAKGPR